MMTDPIADMLTRIRNALAVKKPKVTIPYSKIKLAIAKILEKENFISGFEIVSNKKNKFKNIVINLKYKDGNPAIHELKRISKPGCRIYVKVKEIRKVKGGRGIWIISTSRGIMTGHEAKKRKLGGELIAEIW
jgi:small subunit ribosomal protein S8